MADPYTAQIIGKDCGIALVRVAMSLRRNLGLTLTGRQRDGAGLQQITGASFAAIAARNKRLLAAFFKDKAQIAGGGKAEF